MNEVYVIAGGEWLRNNRNAIAAFMGTRTWDSIEKIALTLSFLAVAVMWVQRHNDGFAGLRPCLCLSACWLMSVHRCRLLITVTGPVHWGIACRTGDATFTDDPYACNGGQFTR